MSAPLAHAQSLTAREQPFEIKAQPLAHALIEFSDQTGIQVVTSGYDLLNHSTTGVAGSYTAQNALELLLKDTGLSYQVVSEGTVALSDPNAPVVVPEGPKESAVPTQGDAGAAGSATPARRGDIEEIIVTAQKREERLLDVPIAMTALSAESLDAFKIEGGSELLRAIPNVNFSKSNFSMYNFSIRGVGTKAISASSDPAVAVSFNNTPLIRNRLFESEFFDMARVEVLRGPQGTLYGRNATAGVVNLIPALPDSTFGGEIKVEGGNFNTKRIGGMINVPIGDSFGLRAAGAWTQRDGYDYNTYTQQDVNGRDLWSGRLSAAWEPGERFRANLIWQHFEEDDNRSRTGKQLCTRDPGPTEIGGVTIATPGIQGRMSQGCLPRSLYDDAAFDAPNAYALTYFTVPMGISIGRHATLNQQIPLMTVSDPYANVVQSRNLREIATTYDPVFRADNDVVQLNLEFEVSDGMTLVSQTAYSRDDYYSSQDYSRFATGPIFSDSLLPRRGASGNTLVDNSVVTGPTPNGQFCDPQLGCSEGALSVDISQSKNNQWSQELRLQSDFEGPFNFNLGANYLRFESQDDYYIFNNMFTVIAQYYYADLHPVYRVRVPRACSSVLGYEDGECIYVDPNPINQVNNQGHNYFLSQNGIETTSSSVFGELYWQFSDALKLTAGLRYTHDRKISSQIPTQLMLAGGVNGPNPGGNTGGRVNSGYPATQDIKQAWDAVTGRLVLDWKPTLSFTDDTLVYVSLAHGYKGGGTNPPRVDMDPRIVTLQELDTTFKPEYVNAIELGVKNSFAGGKLMLNATTFLYDYTDYQVSQIVDRIAFNENFDALNWGVELEAVIRPTRALRMDASVGYLRTRIDEGEGSIDVMNRTQGNPDWVVVRPWLQAPSNCVAPRVLIEKVFQGMAAFHELAPMGFCPSSNRLGDFNPATTGGMTFDTFYNFTYNPVLPYNPATVGLNIADGGSGAPNQGRGFDADLGGNELPNAPRWTFNLGTQYTFDISDWALTVRGDYYWQDQSYGRVYNTEFDRLRSWDNTNLSFTLDHPRLGLTFQTYVKNVFDKTPITDFFVNSDDTGLTTNVFTLDPRLFGVSVRKTF